MGYTTFKAKTVGDLLEVLLYLKREGYDMDARWNGFDDALLYIHSEHVSWVAIDPGES